MGFAGSLLAAATFANASQDVAAVDLQNGLGIDTNPRNTSPAYPAPGPKVYVVEQGLPEFLRQVARQNGYEITLSNRVRGTLRRVEMPLDIKEILRRLAGEFDLRWRFHDKRIFVSVGSEEPIQR